MWDVSVVAFLGIGTGYLLARGADAIWPSLCEDDLRIQVRERVPLLATGLGVMAAIYYGQDGVSLTLFKNCLFAAVMLAIERVNRRTFLVPNFITMPGMLLGVLLSAFTAPGAIPALIGIAAGGGALLLVAELHFRSTGREGLGMGIVKLQALIGAFLGWQLAGVALFFGTVTGSIAGLIALRTRRESGALLLPFGSHLALGAVLATAVGQAILSWYLSHLR